MNTILLDTATWDMTVDVFGNIAMATDPYAPAQDVASACRLFQGELWFAQERGIPYFQKILGKLPAVQFLKSQLVAAALTVPEVATAVCFLTSFIRRTVGGQIQLTLTSGATAVVTTNELQGQLPWYVNAASPQALGSTEGGP